MRPRVRATARTSQYSRFSRMGSSRIVEGKDQFSLWMRLAFHPSKQRSLAGGPGLPLLAVFGLKKVLRYAADKRDCSLGYIHATLEDGLEAVRLAVVERGVLGVLG